MTFNVKEDCARLGLRAGAIVFHDVHVTASSPDQRSVIASEAAIVRGRYSSLGAIRADPSVSSFHAILRQIGGHSKTDRPSLERLLTFAFKRTDLPEINNLV